MRSPALTNLGGFPRKAMMFHTITNMNVARDEETQAMRRRMYRLLLIVLAGFAVGGLVSDPFLRVRA
ncbi:hypothetical protein NKH19_16615 [Mesorhizobium sp. M1338]|uniref:hypothetical protein n=1 Tax=unclassified Mesorhizobium TaxID=325217 RepID=UPI0033366514